MFIFNIYLEENSFLLKFLYLVIILFPNLNNIKDKEWERSLRMI